MVSKLIIIDQIRGAIKIKNVDKVKTFGWTGGGAGQPLAELWNIKKNSEVKSIFLLRGGVRAKNIGWTLKNIFIQIHSWNMTLSSHQITIFGPKSPSFLA